MKLIYIILFLIDVAILLLLGLMFLQSVDNHSAFYKLISIAAGMILSIVLLVYCLNEYTKHTTGAE